MKKINYRLFATLFGVSCLLAYSMLMYATFLKAFFSGGEVLIMINYYGEMWVEMIITPIALAFGIYATYNVFKTQIHVKNNSKLKITKNEKQLAITALALLCVFFTVAGLWAIDIGASAMIAQSAGIDMKVSNGWFVRSGIQQYHMGLYMVTIAMLFLSFLTLISIFSKNKE